MIIITYIEKNNCSKRSKKSNHWKIWNPAFRFRSSRDESIKRERELFDPSFKLKLSALGRAYARRDINIVLYVGNNAQFFPQLLEWCCNRKKSCGISLVPISQKFTWIRKISSIKRDKGKRKKTVKFESQCYVFILMRQSWIFFYEKEIVRVR